MIKTWQNNVTGAKNRSIFSNMTILPAVTEKIDKIENFFIITGLSLYMRKIITYNLEKSIIKINQHKMSVVVCFLIKINQLS